MESVTDGTVLEGEGIENDEMLTEKKQETEITLSMIMMRMTRLTIDSVQRGRILEFYVKQGIKAKSM